MPRSMGSNASDSCRACHVLGGRASLQYHKSRHVGKRLSAKDSSLLELLQACHKKRTHTIALLQQT
jgi:hypothetical protein